MSPSKEHQQQIASYMTTSRRSSSMMNRIPSLLTIAFMMNLSKEAAAFQGRSNSLSFIKPSSPVSSLPLVKPQQQFETIRSSSTATTQLQAVAAMDALDTFYKTQPFLAAFLTCSVKASAADFVAQTSSSDEDDGSNEAKVEEDQPSFQTWFESTFGKAEATAKEGLNTAIEDTKRNLFGDSSFCVNRNIAFWLYGGLYQGMFLQFLYVAVYPFVLQDVHNPILHTVLQVIIDIFVFGPFLTLPIAYIIRSILDATVTGGDEEQQGKEAMMATISSNEANLSPSQDWTTLIPEAAKQGVDKYVNHIQTQNVLLKFWMLWGPAQCITFGVIPEHFRVVFVAFVSFFWVTILSSISAQEVSVVEEEPIIKGLESKINNENTEVEQEKKVKERMLV